MYPHNFSDIQSCHPVLQKSCTVAILFCKRAVQRLCLTFCMPGVLQQLFGTLLDLMSQNYSTTTVSKGNSSSSRTMHLHTPQIWSKIGLLSKQTMRCGQKVYGRPVRRIFPLSRTFGPKCKVSLLQSEMKQKQTTRLISVFAIFLGDFLPSGASPCMRLYLAVLSNYVLPTSKLFLAKVSVVYMYLYTFSMCFLLFLAKVSVVYMYLYTFSMCFLQVISHTKYELKISTFDVFFMVEKS